MVEHQRRARIPMLIGIISGLSGTLWYWLGTVIIGPGGTWREYGPLWLPDSAWWTQSALASLLVGILALVANLWEMRSARLHEARAASRQAKIGLIGSVVGLGWVVLGFLLQQFLIRRMWG